MSLISHVKKHLYLLVASYFKFFANFSLRRWRPRIIAITGSVGKTTMLNLVESQLGDKAHYNHDANSPFGIAFDILGLRGITGSKLRWIYLFLATPIRAIHYTHSEKLYFVEIDGERPHETTFLARWLRPEVTVWVSLGRSHAVFHEKEVASGRFSSIDAAIAHEFAELPRYTKKLVITDADVHEMNVRDRHAKLLPVSKSTVTNYTAYPDHVTFKIDKHQLTLPAPYPPDIAIQLVMLEALLDYLKIPLDPTFANLRIAPGRSSHFKGKKGIDIIDSTYNAHLQSVEAVMQMVKVLHAPHKWVVIGDIVDQGSYAAEEHQKLAGVLLDGAPERIILVGRRTHEYTFPILQKTAITTVSFASVKEALKYLEDNITGKETIIFKGSQYLEWLVEKLLLDTADIAKLPRQDKAARKRRQDWGLS